MNKVEGFFAVGAIFGPAIVSYLLIAGVSWTYLYVFAGVLCSILCIFAWRTDYPIAPQKNPTEQKSNFNQTLSLLKNRYALGFSLAIALYVATEVAIYVWMPTLLQEYQGNWPLLATYALTLFFVLRALGRFLAVWLLQHFSWQSVMMTLSGLIFLCYLGTLLYGVNVAVLLLPLCGLFMSMIYPTLNSKGISCFMPQQHGAIAGVILFFTALSAAVAPFLMGVISDYFGHVKYGFVLATGFAFLLFIGMIYNWFYDPSAKALK